MAKYGRITPKKRDNSAEKQLLQNESLNCNYSNNRLMIK